MLPANDNHQRWRHAPFTRRRILLVIGALIIGIAAGASIAALIKGDGWPYWIAANLF